MPASGSSKARGTKATTGTTTKATGTTGATAATRRRGAEGAAAYVRQTAERSVDVPVGAVLTVADRVNEIVEPWSSRPRAERELKSLRSQVTREFNRIERRGTSAPAGPPSARGRPATTSGATSASAAAPWSAR
jgi:hypothetical protein